MQLGKAQKACLDADLRPSSSRLVSAATRESVFYQHAGQLLQQSFRRREWPSRPLQVAIVPAIRWWSEWWLAPRTKQSWETRRSTTENTRVNHCILKAIVTEKVSKWAQSILPSRSIRNGLEQVSTAQRVAGIGAWQHSAHVWALGSAWSVNAAKHSPEKALTVVCGQL